MPLPERPHLDSKPSGAPSLAAHDQPRLRLEHFALLVVAAFLLFCALVQPAAFRELAAFLFGLP